MKTPLIKISLVHIFFTALLGFAIVKLGFDMSWPRYIWGAALSGSQMLFLVILGYRVIYKKGVAMTLALSVIKYGILLGIFVLAGAGYFRITSSFALGCIAIVPSLTSLIFLRPYILKGF